MLDLDTRSAILKLHEQGHGRRAIARLVGVSRHSVRQVLASGIREVATLERPSQLDPHLETIRGLHVLCEGNLVRVAELLAERGVRVGYSTVTAFCRRHGIGVTPKTPVGHYDFPPGKEMQHDTSPHTVTIAGQKRLLQCASLILCYSRMRYAQVYPRWSRFECRIFHSEALAYFGGSAEREVIDNSSVIISRGTGRNAIPAPEMAALAERFGFYFLAHNVGDADRSAYVERGFHYIENNFYPGRSFASVEDCNAQLRNWCETVNHSHRKRLHAKPTELFAVEQPVLKPLPAHIPEIYELHRRHVDVHGFVCVHTNRYSVPAALIGQQLDVRETKDRIRVFRGHQLVADHDRQEPGAQRRILHPDHNAISRSRHVPPPPSPQEQQLRHAGPELAALVDALQRHSKGRAVRAIRRLHELWRDYPEEPLRAAVAHALQYDLVDLKRIERLILQQIAGDFFRLYSDDEEDRHG